MNRSPLVDRPVIVGGQFGEREEDGSIGFADVRGDGQRYFQTALRIENVLDRRPDPADGKSDEIGVPLAERLQGVGRDARIELDARARRQRLAEYVLERPRGDDGLAAKRVIVLVRRAQLGEEIGTREDPRHLESEGRGLCHLRKFDVGAQLFRVAEKDCD